MQIVKTPIVQFGTSRFLQAHADLFISDAMRDGQAVGPVTVVQTSGAADRAGRLAAFDGRPLPIVVRGWRMASRSSVQSTRLASSVASQSTDWAEVERIVVEETSEIISNTGDSGYRIPEGETIGDSVPVSFPAKLTRLLAARWEKSGVPLTIFPTELVPDNGVVLRRLCTEIAGRSGLPSAFLAWLNEDCVFANSLVDRITTTALEPAGAVTEPYALWAIERQTG